MEVHFCSYNILLKHQNSNKMGSCSSKDTSKKRSNKKPATRRFKKKVDNGFDEI